MFLTETGLCALPRSACLGVTTYGIDNLSSELDHCVLCRKKIIPEKGIIFAGSLLMLEFLTFNGGKYLRST